MEDGMKGTVLNRRFEISMNDSRIKIIEYAFRQLEESGQVTHTPKLRQLHSTKLEVNTEQQQPLCCILLCGFSLGHKHQSICFVHPFSIQAVTSFFIPLEVVEDSGNL